MNIFLVIIKEHEQFKIIVPEWLIENFVKNFVHEKIIVQKYFLDVIEKTIDKEKMIEIVTNILDNVIHKYEVEGEKIFIFQKIKEKMHYVKILQHIKINLKN